MSIRAVDPYSLLAQIPFKPETVTINNTSFPYMRLEIPIPPIDPLEWLEAQQMYPKVYFETEAEKVAGIGKVFVSDQIPKFAEEGPSPILYGGMDFFKRRSDTWGNFPPCCYFLPQVEIEVRKNGTYLCINRTEQEIPHFTLNTASLNSEKIIAKSRHDTPMFSEWDKQIRECLACQTLKKIVLARCSTFECETISPLSICKFLQTRSKAKAIFAFSFDPNSVFIGATPELFYQRKGKMIESVALAGTRRRGKTTEEDEALKEELLQCEKDLYEFNLVKETIRSALAPLCERLNPPTENQILETTTVQHLYHKIQGELKEAIQDEALISRLHPTPALGGLPRNESMNKIRSLETFDRGWYGAPIGKISRDATTLVVAIRSTLIKNQTLSLFSGAGIVQGSVPEKEWQEIEDKIALLKGLMDEKSNR